MCLGRDGDACRLSEFCRWAVSLVVDEGLRPRRSQRNVGPEQSGLRRWVEAGRKPGVTGDELVRLRRERRVLRMEHDLLSRAEVFFAGGTSSRKWRSGSSGWESASFAVAFAGDRLSVSRAGQ